MGWKVPPGVDRVISRGTGEEFLPGKAYENIPAGCKGVMVECDDMPAPKPKRKPQSKPKVQKGGG